MRVVLAFEGTRGDFQPMLGLAHALREAGHAAELCGPVDFAEAVAEGGFRFHPVAFDVRAYLQANARALTGGSWRLQRAAIRYFRTALGTQFDALPPVLAGADLVLGGGVQIAAPTLCEHLGVPYRFVLYAPILLPSGDYPPMVLERQGLPPWANRAAWRVFLATYGHVLRRPLDRRRAALGLPPVGDVYRHLLGERPILAADPELAPYPPDCPVAAQPVGQLHRGVPEPLPGKLEDFLAAGPAPVYVGFGSMTDPRPAATTRMLLAALAEAGCRAIVSAGWAGLGEAALPADVVAVGPVSHDALFPRVAAVVHHGGAGTTHAAARAGVPQIVVPHLADQFYWAARMHRLGVSPPPLPRRRLAAGRLAERLRSLEDNELLEEAARALGERVRARADLGRSARRVLGEA